MGTKAKQTHTLSKIIKSQDWGEHFFQQGTNRVRRKKRKASTSPSTGQPRWKRGQTVDTERYENPYCSSRRKKPGQSTDTPRKTYVERVLQSLPTKFTRGKREEVITTFTKVIQGRKNYQAQNALCQANMNPKRLGVPDNAPTFDQVWRGKVLLNTQK